MMPTLTSRWPRPRLAVPVVAAALLAASLPEAGRAQCSLTDATNWCVQQDSNGVPGGAENNDHFGGALAFGDFNGDGYDDLAVGVPGENNDAGVVHVFYSNGFQLSLAGQQLFSQDEVGGDADEGAESGDQFGFALAAGDFDHNGFVDLAIGSPGEDLPDAGSSCSFFTCQHAGGVHVLYGGPFGLQTAGSEFVNVRDLTDRGPHENGRLGATLVAANTNPAFDDFCDLLIGEPGKDDEGAVLVARGAAGGLFSSSASERSVGSSCDSAASSFGISIAVGDFGNVGPGLLVGNPDCSAAGVAGAGTIAYFSQATAAFEYSLIQSDYGSAGEGTGDHFGAALAIGDFDGDGFADLAAGAPNKNHGAGNPAESGRVYVAYGDPGGPDPSVAPDLIGEDEWAGDTPGAGEHFGSALAGGDVDGNGFADLLAGAPGEGSTDVGRIYLKRGSAAGLTTTNNELFTQTFLGGSNGADDHLGNVIALGDIDGDGVLEIALGVPDKDVGTANDAGMVYVTRAFARRLFLDGFESGNKTAWSASTP
jgi:FG-GAP repeat protein